MLVSGAIDLRVDATGSLERPDLSATLRMTDGRVPLTAEHAVTGALISATYSTGVLTIEQLRAGFQGAALEATGRIPADLIRELLPERWRELVPPSSGPADVKAQLTSVTELVAAPFAEAPRSLCRRIPRCSTT